MLQYCLLSSNDIADLLKSIIITIYNIYYGSYNNCGSKEDTHFTELYALQEHPPGKGPSCTASVAGLRGSTGGWRSLVRS